ncbi:MAG: hypothetical protein H7335_16040 [Massilia sp.]|nr:hypothetical protein [Massilia sp.]
MRQLKKHVLLPASALAACLLMTGCGGDATAPDAPPVTSAPSVKTAPTVLLATSAAGTLATGPVTFTFTFSADVGNSFTIDNITVTGGTAGTLTRVSGTVATLIVTPPAASSGSISVSVAAGKFSDLAGTANVVAATATQAYATAAAIVKTQMSLPVTFDSTSVGYGLIGFGGAEDSSIAADPSNAANMVAKVVRAAGAETYAGTTISAVAGLGFTPKLAFDANNTKLSVRVWSPDAGIPVRLKVEDHANATNSVETEAITTQASGWQTLTFDFAAQAAGTAAVNFSYRYDKATIFFDFGRAKAAAVQKTYYFDDVSFVPGSAIVTASAVITFDETSAPVLSGFGGAEDASIVSDPANAANKVAKIVKSAGAESWAGTTVSNLPNLAIAPLGFTAANATMTARVWSADAGIPVRVKVEDAADASKTVETEALTTVANGWQTLTFNFANQAAGTAALNLATRYNKVSVFFNFGKTGAQAGAKTYYLDDINYVVGTGSVAGTGATFGAMTFDEAAAPLLTDFGLYGVAGAIVTDPSGVSNKVGKVYKGTNSEMWGGTTVSTLANQAVATIPFSSTSKKMTLRVYSPAVGVRVHLKVENAGNASINSEVNALTTQANSWETLTFDFGDTSTMYVPNGPTTYNTSMPTSPLNLANTYNKTSLFFDFGLGNGGYAAMPGNRVYYFDDLKFVP